MGGKDAVNGKVGEAYTARELKLLNLLGRKGKVLRNVYIPKDNNRDIGNRCFVYYSEGNFCN